MKDLCLAPQRNQMIIPFIITVTGGAPAMTEGGSWMTVADGAAGVYAITFGGLYGAKSARTPVVVATCETATGVDLIATVVSSSVSGFTIEVSADDGTLTEATIVHGMVCWFGSADQR